MDNSEAVNINGLGSFLFHSLFCVICELNVPLCLGLPFKIANTSSNMTAYHGTVHQEI